MKPGVRAFGRVTAAYLRRIAPAVRVPDGGASLRQMEVIRRRHAGRKLVLFYWIRDVLPMMLVDWKQRSQAMGWSEDIEFVCDESYGGSVAASALDGLGRRTRMLHWSRAIDRIRDLQAIIRSTEPMGIAVDGHGPYGEVGEGFARLVARCRAVAVPVSALAARGWTLPVPGSLVLPRPRSAVTFVLGTPIAGDASQEPTAPDLRAALEAAEAESRRALAGGVVGAPAGRP